MPKINLRMEDVMVKRTPEVDKFVAQMVMAHITLGNFLVEKFADELYERQTGNKYGKVPKEVIQATVEEVVDAYDTQFGMGLAMRDESKVLPRTIMEMLNAGKEEKDE